MILHPAQNQIAECNARFITFVCGRKFGKTTLEAEEIKGESILEDGTRTLYLAPSLGDARRLMWERLKRELNPAMVNENDTRLELKVRNTKGGFSDVFLGSWELVDNYRGDEYNLIVADEVQLYRNFWTGWHEALRPTLTPRRGRAIFAGTTKGFNHLYDLYNMGLTDPDYKSFKFTTYDNPFIPRDEIEKAKQELTPDRFAQEYLAEFKKAEGLVIKEFDREKHVFNEEITGFTEKLAGVDWGHRNPAAVPTVLVKDGVYYVRTLLYKTGMTDADVADYVAAGKFNKVFPDPESASGVEELKRRGVNAQQVHKGADSIIHGVDKIRELFLANRLFIHASCLDLISELESYSYPDSRPGHNPNENPQDENNHAIDALRYVVSTHTVNKPYVPRPFRDKTIEIWQGR